MVALAKQHTKNYKEASHQIASYAHPIVTDLRTLALQVSLCIITAYIIKRTVEATKKDRKVNYYNSYGSGWFGKQVFPQPGVQKLRTAIKPPGDA
eukprot:3762625-Amphidinium_carterae.1